MGKKTWMEYAISGRIPLPSQLYLDPMSACNLSCELCPTGQGLPNDFKRKMPLATFQSVLEKMTSVRRLNLFNIGESFQHPDIFEMIRLATARGIRVTIHSNFSLTRDAAFFEAIVTSGLDHLRIAVDGATQETYEQHRKGGNLALVLSNLRSLVATKQKLESALPRITVGFIVSKKNEADAPKVKAIADELGVDFERKQLFLGYEWVDFPVEGDGESWKRQWLPSEAADIREYYKDSEGPAPAPGRCGALFDSCVINPEGKITPCCWANKKEAVMGDLLTQSFDDIWNGESYRFARSRFVPTLGAPASGKVVCEQCRLYRPPGDPHP